MTEQDESEPGIEPMRLDALAAAAGVASTTVRLYQQRGLLPGPRLVGRTGWYDQAHLTRLRLIARLQGEGFSLAGIAKLLETWEQGRALADLVDVEAQFDALLHGRTPLELDPVELAERFPPEALDPVAMARAVALGLVALTDDGRVRVPDARFVEVGSDLARMGVPVGVVLDEWEALTAHTDEIAQRFVAVFEEHLLPDGWADGLDDARVAALAASLAHLQRDAGQVLLAALDASMAAAASDRLRGLVAPEG